jgi:hypothetical protein
MIMSANLARGELVSSSRSCLTLVGVVLLGFRGFLEGLGLGEELDVAEVLASTCQELTKSSISSRRERLAVMVADVMGRNGPNRL